MLQSKAKSRTYEITTQSRPRPRGWQAPFLLVWGGQTFSLVGSALVRFALIWWMTETTGSAAVLAIGSLAALLPPIVLGPLAGTLIDRWNRRWVMIAADGAIAFLTGILAVLYWQGAVQTWHVYAALFLRAVGTAFHNPAMTASTSLMVPEEHLTRVAGMNQTRQSIAQFAGPPLGALLVMLLPIQGVLLIDIVTALLAIGPLLFIDVPQPHSSGHGAKRKSVLRETVHGFRYLWRWRGMFVVLATFSLALFFHQPAISMAPLLVREHFGGGAVEWSWACAAFQIGSIGGGLLMSTWGGFKRRYLNLLLGISVYGCVNLVRGLAPANAFWLYVTATLLFGPAAAMALASLRAILQSTAPPEMQGRVFAVQNSLSNAMAPLGLITLGPAANLIGIQTIFVLDGVVGLLVAVTWALLPSVRRLQDGPPERTPALPA